MGEHLISSLLSSLADDAARYSMNEEAEVYNWGLVV